jgi:hypothetical protein
MDASIVREAFWRVSGWGLRHRGRQLVTLGGRRRASRNSDRA